MTLKSKSIHSSQIKQILCIATIICTALLLSSAKADSAQQSDNAQYFKMLSSVEYSGKTQFRNQVQTLVSVKKEPLPDNKTRYTLSAKDFSLAPNNKSAQNEMSFAVDQNTKQLLETENNFAFFGKLNNACIKSLTKLPKENIDKTWKQSFDLPFLGDSLPQSLKFTMTAIRLNSKDVGEIIAVRALSEPFTFKTFKQTGKNIGNVQSRVNTLYLFDPKFEDIYMSISVFAASTDLNGFKENLRHEIATYKTDSKGNPAIISKLDKDFEKFASKVGLEKESLKVIKPSPLPRWTYANGLIAAQISNICAAIACEGGINPVAIVYLPAVHTVSMQSTGVLASMGGTAAISSSLVTAVPAMSGMHIAVAPALMGGGLGTVGIAGGATAGGVAVAGGGGGGSSSRSPSTP